MDVQPNRHPSDQTLGAFGLGKLDDAVAEVVIQHLEQCPECRDRVKEMPADSFLQRFREARRAGHSRFGGLEPDRSQDRRVTRTLEASPAHTLPPGLAEHPDYKILRELGRGGMGVVYLAQNELMGRQEVLKVVSGQMINRPLVPDRFLREIRSAAKLRHPNIVAAYSAFRLGEDLVLAMEYVEGLNLARLVKSKGPLPIANACNFVCQAALGLQHAHAHDMVHRDINPSNLMLSREGKKAVVKVLDFGLAKITSEGRADSGLTSEGQVLGTPDFIAPEQIRDAQSADIRADVYSLGCTLYYLLAGRPPFHGDSLWDLYQAHFSMEAGPLNTLRPDVPAELSALVAKMMAKEPARRFQTPSEVAQALIPFFKPAASPEPAPSPTGESAAVTRADRAASVSPVESDGDRAPSSIAEPEPAGLMRALAVGSPGRARRAKLTVAAAVLLLGLFAVWAIVLRVKTSNGIIELIDLPADAEVLVDGGKVSLKWSGEGKPAVVEVTAGRHRVKVKKDGLETSGEEVSVRAGGQVEFTVRLLPLSGSPPETGEVADRRADSADRKDRHAESGAGAGSDEARSASNDGHPTALKAPFDAATAKKAQTAWADHLKTPVESTNSVEMKLVLIPPGEFLMGSPGDDKDATDEEKPQHRVRIERPFYAGATEVTRSQFRRFVEEKGYKTEVEKDGKGGWSWDAAKQWVQDPRFTWRTPGFDQTEDHPVVIVTSNDASAFCDWLSRREGRTYRLLTEAEWEYACRAGTTTRFSFGDDESALEQYAWCAANSGNHTHPVAQKKPNAFGLYDMHGNVWERCSDGYDAAYYRRSPEVDPPGSPQAAQRVTRGGGWFDHPRYRRSACRGSNPPGSQNFNMGFRVARSLESGEKSGLLVHSGPPSGSRPGHEGPPAVGGVSPAPGKSVRGEDQPPRDPAIIEKDRRAAESMLLRGASVTLRLHGQEVVIVPGLPLLTEAFELTRVRLGDRPEVTDADLLPLEGLANLVELQLSKAAKITDAGVAHLRNLRRIEKLWLEGTGLTDAGLVHLENLSTIQELYLGGTGITDAGLERLKGLAQLKRLGVGHTRITGAGFVHLGRLSELEALGAEASGVSGESFVHLRGLTKLRTLVLWETRVSDAGLEHLESLQQLESLALLGPGLTDAGLMRLGRLAKLQWLGLGGARATDAGLIYLENLKELRHLNLDNTLVTDAGLQRLIRLPQLNDLRLNGTAVTNDGLERLQGPTLLKELHLRNTNVSAAGAERVQKRFPACQIFTEPPRGTDLEKLQGNWVEDACELNGEAVIFGVQRPRATRIISRDQSFVNGGEGFAVDVLTFTLIPGQTPRAINVAVVRGPDVGQTSVGIYRLDGDKLWICWTSAGRERPTGFVTKPGTDTCFQVWKRAP